MSVMILNDHDAKNASRQQQLYFYRLTLEFDFVGMLHLDNFEF